VRKSLTKCVANVRSMINTPELQLIDKHCDPDFLITQAKLEIMTLENRGAAGLPHETKRLALLKIASLIVLALDKQDATTQR